MPSDNTDRYRLKRTYPARQGAKLPKPKDGEHFLCGPIPLLWLQQASQLPGRSLNVALALWYLAGLTKSATVALPNKLSSKFGVDRNAKYRALNWLSNAGLVSVERKIGQAPRVTIEPSARLDLDPET